MYKPVYRIEWNIKACAYMIRDFTVKNFAKIQ